MKISITFTQSSKVLTKVIYEIDKPEDFPDVISTAHKQFEKENPDVLLFDGVAVHYDKSD